VRSNRLVAVTNSCLGSAEPRCPDLPISRLPRRGESRLYLRPATCRGSASLGLGQLGSTQLYRRACLPSLALHIVDAGCGSLLLKLRKLGLGSPPASASSPSSSTLRA